MVKRGAGGAGVGAGVGAGAGTGDGAGGVLGAVGDDTGLPLHAVAANATRTTAARMGFNGGIIGGAAGYPRKTRVQEKGQSK